jgi:hypothetical protein
MLDGFGPLYLGTIGLAALLALWAAIAAMRRLGNGEPLKAVVRLLNAGVFGLFAIALVAIGMDLRTYARLTHEQAGATLTFRQVGERHYALELEQSDGGFRALDLRGDEWQLDARILKWSGFGTVLGLDTRWRLERVSGRYRDVRMEQEAPRTVHDLAPPETGFDLWAFAQGKPWLPFVDATYGSATYLPLADGARYAVTVSSTGLVARPANEVARRAVAGWRADAPAEAVAPEAPRP